MPLPLVSICIPTFNGGKYLQEALDSVSRQSYRNLEVVISDDGSIDDTLKIIQNFKISVSFPVYFYNHEPTSIGANWNNCIRRANGEYIKFLFQDDVLEPMCITSFANVLLKNDSIGLVASKRSFIIENSCLNNNIKNWLKSFDDLQRNLRFPIINGMQILDKRLFKSDQFLNSPLNKIGEPSVTLFRKKITEEIGYFREDLRQNLDYEFYYRLLKKHKIGILEKELVSFRIHSQQATQVNWGKVESDYLKYDKLIFKEYFWQLNFKKQLEYLKKYNTIVKTALRIRKKILK